MAIRDNPLFTDIYSKITDFIPEDGSVYLFCETPEERSAHFQEWETSTNNVKFIRIEETASNELIAYNARKATTHSLRSEKQLEDLLGVFARNTVYIDITGLSHSAWAPLLKVGLRVCNKVKVVYVEPSTYRFSPTLKEGEIFDLSEKISGISPIPGFISLKEPMSEDNVCFVPLLGFEGTRFAYINENVQPPGEKIVPIIGVPGFRPEYPFYTYQGNQLPLTGTRAWRNVRYAIANCPFSLFYALEDISEHYSGNFLKIAPIGTKPHALGAVLFAIINQNNVELVYDHPIRKASRTEGTSRLLVYNVSIFMSSSITI